MAKAEPQPLPTLSLARGHNTPLILTVWQWHENLCPSLTGNTTQTSVQLPGGDKGALIPPSQRTQHNPLAWQW